MKPDRDKDITKLMAEVLREQSLSYEDGSWERFKELEASRNKTRVLWPYFSAIAAIALVVFGVLITINQDPDLVPQELTNTKVAVPDFKNDLKRNLETPVVIKQTPEPQPKELRYMAYQSVSKEEIIPETFSVALNADIRSSITEESSMTNGKTPEDDQEPAQDEEPALARKSPVTSFDPMVLTDGQSVLAEDVNSKWSFSLELSPNIKNNEVNFGGGMAVSYALTDRFSISSGVSYVALDAQRGPSQVDIPQEFSKTSLSNYNYNKSLNTINTSLVGLDIPLNLRFEVNTKMYASAGISVFNVLHESRYNLFEEHVAVLAFKGNEESSLSSPEPVIQKIYTQEESQETPYEGRNFTGFFNFSVGYKLPVFKKLNLAVEPYIKVPIGSLSEQDMDLSNGGLKIITTF